MRSYSEDGWSNPKKIVERMIQNIEESQNGTTSYETLLNWMMDYYQEQGYITNNRPLTKSVWRTLTWICQEKLGVLLNEIVGDLQKTCEEMVFLLKQETGLGNLLEDVSKIINFGSITYAEGFDKVCFIVDRDRKSFSENQYEYVLEQCKKRKFGLYLTNPCFEFWLLMHFDDVVELDKEQLFENPMVTSERSYSEQELRKRIPGYKKSKYDAMTLVKNIDIAINNEKIFCEDIEKLKDVIGSNIGLLICEMQN